MSSYLQSVKKQFRYYKNLGDKSLDQLVFDEIIANNEDANSIAIIAKHISGNMLSRWTNFLTEDGEKSWRHRDNEFIDVFEDKASILAYWEKGWNCLFSAFNELTDDHLEDIVYIRNQGHTVIEAINRQLMHYAYHIGQIVYIAKTIRGSEWQSLSVPKGKSVVYNQEKFSKDKGKRHFTEDL